MFSETKKNKMNQETSSSQNIIAKGAVIKGNFNCQGDIRVDGTIDGEVKSAGKIVIGKNGLIKGAVTAKDAYIEGEFSGHLNLSGTLTLKATAMVEGEVVLNKLAVEPGAKFNVKCTMTSAVKSIKGERKTEKTA